MTYNPKAVTPAFERYSMLGMDGRAALPAEEQAEYKRLWNEVYTPEPPTQGEKDFSKSILERCKQQTRETEAIIAKCEKQIAESVRLMAKADAAKPATTPLQIYSQLTMEERKMLSPSAQLKMKAILDANKPVVAPAKYRTPAFALKPTTTKPKMTYL